MIRCHWHDFNCKLSENYTVRIQVVVKLQFSDIQIVFITKFYGLNYKVQLNKKIKFDTSEINGKNSWWRLHRLYAVGVNLKYGSMMKNFTIWIVAHKISFLRFFWSIVVWIYVRKMFFAVTVESVSAIMLIFVIYVQWKFRLPI